MKTLLTRFTASLLAVLLLSSGLMVCADEVSNSGCVQKNIEIFEYYPDTFVDIGNLPDFMQEAINALHANGIVNGTSDNTFSPELDISRGQFVAMLMRSMKKIDNDLPCPFTDIPRDKYYRDYATNAAREGYMNGYSETVFGGDDPLTRQQICVILSRVLKANGKSFSGNTASVLARYQPPVSADSYAMDAIVFLTEQNVIPLNENGVYLLSGDGSFTGTDRVTRGEMAVLLYNILPKNQEAG